MSEQKDLTIAICGAGLAGLGLALALESRGVQCTIYEGADTPERQATGSLTIGPNGQTVLTEYGIWASLAKSSKFYRHARILNNDGQLLNEIVLGDKEAYGYESMRIVRKTLIAKMADAVRSRGIEIICKKKLLRVLSETSSGVLVEFEDGTTSTASLLIGADGIYSCIRRSLYPNVETQYIGSVAVGGSVSASKIMELPKTSYGLYISQHGSAMIGSHVPDDSDYIAFVGKPHADLGRSGWKSMFENKEKMRQFLNDDLSDWPPYVQSAISNIREDELWLWPMYVLPELKSWTSPNGRIVLMGDAAHAVPPTAGQGANMALEDAYTLGLVLGSMGPDVLMESALAFWEDLRKERIRQVLELSMQWANMRDPPGTRDVIPNHHAFKTASTQECRIEQMRWLYGGLMEQKRKIEAWTSSRKPEIRVT